MSHFTVMVIGNNPEEQLEQYNADLKVEEYEDGEVSDAEKQNMMSYYAKEGHIFTSFRQCYEQFGEEWDGGICRKNEDGVWHRYSTYNPNSKWDWYVLGGRWSGNFIRLKPDATSGILGKPGTGGNKVGIDAALKGDIDFSAIRKEAEEKASKYYHSQNTAKCRKDTSLKDSFFDPQLKAFQCTETEFINCYSLSTFIPYALIKDGEWYDAGDVDWRNVFSNKIPKNEWLNKVWEMLMTLPDDTLISFYDCHI